MRNDYFSGLVYFIFLFWVLTKKGTREMKITVAAATENPDGSVDCLVNFDAEGLGFLVQEGIIAIFKQCINQAKKEAKRKAENERRTK